MALDSASRVLILRRVSLDQAPESTSSDHAAAAEMSPALEHEGDEAPVLPAPALTLAMAMGTAVIAGLGAGKLLGAARKPGIEALLAERPRPLALAAPTPRPPSAPAIDWTHVTPVTDRPAHVTYLWCHRFHMRTNPRDRRRIVASAASRSQYDRVSKAIFTHWGAELDARGVSFQRLRWIAAPEDFIERQDRYLRALRGELPEDLKKKPRTKPLRRALLRRSERLPASSDVGEEVCGDAPASAGEERCPWCGAPAGTSRRRQRCRRRSRPRAEPRAAQSCDVE